MTLRTEPVVFWQTPLDTADHHAQLTRTGQLLARWPPAPFEETATDCVRVGDEYWIWQPGVGGIQFYLDRPEFFAFPSTHVDRAWFEHLVSRSWLPAVYHLWGRQVLHASAVVSTTTRRVIAFVGPSCAGKSTMAYGLGQRPDWSVVCDDTLAFSFEPVETGRGLTLHKLQNDARLRPATASYYGKLGATQELLEWPDGPLDFTGVYFLSGNPAHPRPVTITAVGAATSYRRLLEQAHALTLELPEHNQRLMRDYLELAARIPAFQLEYRHGFDVIEDVFDAVAHHARALDSSVRAPRSPL